MAFLWSAEPDVDMDALTSMTFCAGVIAHVVLGRDLSCIQNLSRTKIDPVRLFLRSIEKHIKQSFNMENKANKVETVSQFNLTMDTAENNGLIPKHINNRQMNCPHIHTTLSRIKIRTRVRISLSIYQDKPEPHTYFCHTTIGLLITD